MRDNHGLLITVAIFFVLVVYGPSLAVQLSGSLDQIIRTLQPYVLTVLALIIGFLVIRGFWRSRY